MSEEVKETMDDFAGELEASYKEYDEQRSPELEQARTRKSGRSSRSRCGIRLCLRSR